MSDIVERLRNMADPKRVGSHFHPLYGEAADVIEKLQEQLGDAQMDLHDTRGSMDTAQYYTKELEIAINSIGERLAVNPADLLNGKAIDLIPDRRS